MNQAMHNNRSNILIVDDENVIVEYVESVFKQSEKFQCIGALSVASALEAIKKYNPDIVFLDIHFGQHHLNGVQCIRLARESGYNGIICIYSSDSSVELLLYGAIVGADDFIIKGGKCNLVEEAHRMLEQKEKDRTWSIENNIVEGAYLRSRGLLREQAALLNDYMRFGYPRIKEFSRMLGISDQIVWKRLSRIKKKLDMDNMSMVAHLLTVVSLLGTFHKEQLPDFASVLPREPSLLSNHSFRN